MTRREEVIDELVERAALIGWRRAAIELADALIWLEGSHIGCSQCGGTGQIPAGPFGGARDRCPTCSGIGSVPILQGCAPPLLGQPPDRPEPT